MMKVPKYFRLNDTRISGIYFVIRKNKIIYIGKTIDLFSRIRQNEVIGKHDRIRIINCSVDKLDAYEARWIMRFRPKYNYQYIFTMAGSRRYNQQYKKAINMDKYRPLAR